MHGSRNFVKGGPGSADRKKTFDNVFYYFLFDISPQLIFSYTEFYKEIYNS